MGVKARWLAGAVLWAAFLPLTVRAGTGFELLEPGKGWWGPRDAFRIRVPAGMPVEVLRRLALELDGIDVTRLLRREGDLAIFTPVEPLAYGGHELRIVEYLPDGSIEERAVWKVEVRQSRAFREADGRLTVSLDATRRVAASDAMDDGPALTGQGTLNVSTRVASGEWRASADVGLGYDSTGSGSPTGKLTDLQSYQFRHEWRFLGLTGGQPALFSEGLLGGTYGNRGVAVDLGETTRSRLRVRAFATRGEPVTGFRRGLGVTEPRNRITGAQAVLFPLRERPERLVLTARTYRAETPTGGEGVLGSTDGERGQGHALSLDSTLRDGRLRLHAELARTRWDPDGRGAVLGYRSDSAYVLGLQWAFLTGASGGTPTEWALTAGHGEVGPYFRSLIDPSTEADQRATQLALAMRRGAFSAGLSLQRVRNNVDDLAELATSRMDTVQANASYEFTEPALRLFRGLSAQATWARVRPLSIPSGVSRLTLTDDRARGLTLTAGLGFMGVTGSLQMGVGDYRSFVSTAPSTRSWSWSLSLTRGFLDDRLGVSAGLGRDFTRDRGTDATTVSDQVSLGLALTGLRGGRVSLSLDGSLNRTQTPADPGTGTDAADDLTRSVGASLGWELVRPRPGSGDPAVTLSLSGTWQETERRMEGTTSREWYVGATLRIGLERSLWRTPADPGRGR